MDKWILLMPSTFMLMALVIGPVRSSESITLSETVETIIGDKIKNDPRTRPGTDNDDPVDLYISIHVTSISKISESNMEYSLTMYLRQKWRDERLAYADKGFNRSISLGYRQFDRIWTPDVFIRNVKSGVFHDITVPNRLIRLDPDGGVLYSQRLTLTLSCDMDLRKYPMDQQKCGVEMGSYGYTTADINMQWILVGDAIKINPDISLPEFELKGTNYYSCAVAYSTTGSFPCLKGQFHLQRRVRSYLLSVYLPSLLVVLLSWVSFWIDLESVPARISLAVITILTISTQTAASNRGLPAVSFVKALDVWMSVCLVYVFGAFLEYAAVNTLNRRRKELREARKAAARSALLKEVDPSATADEQNNFLQHKPEETPLHMPAVKTKTRTWGDWWVSLKYNPALMVDVVSRIFFPVTFFIFNLIYWPIYLCLEFEEIRPGS